MADLKAFAEQLVNLTVKEVNELAQILKDEYGIEPAAAAVAVAAAPAGGGAAAAEEKTSFDVILKDAGASKLNVVKVVKDLTMGSKATPGCRRRLWQRCLNCMASRRHHRPWRASRRNS